MQTEAINTNLEVPEEQEPSQSKPFNFSLDGNLGMRMGLMSGPEGFSIIFFPAPVIFDRFPFHQK